MRVAGVLGRDRRGERAGAGLQGPQPAAQVGEHGLGEPGSDVPGVPQAPAVVDAEQQRADGVRAAAVPGLPAADDDLGVPEVLDLDPVPALPRIVGRGQRLADDAFQVVGQADGLDVPRAAGVPRRCPDQVLVQAQVRQPVPPLGVRRLQQRLLALVEQVEQVQLDRDGLDQPGGRVPDVHAGLQQPEVRSPAADRDDLPVHDHRGGYAAGQDSQLGVARGDVPAGAGEQPQGAAGEVADRADPVPLELPPVPVRVARQVAAQACQHRPDQPRHSPHASSPPRTTHTPYVTPPLSPGGASADDR